MFLNKKTNKKTILSYKIGQNLFIRLHVPLPNIDGYLQIYILQGSVTTQLRCGGTCIFSNHLITNFPQHVTL